MPLQVAIIGCGGTGEMHAACLQHIDGVELRAYCDVNERRAKELLRRFGGAYAGSDVDRIFGDDAIDAVYICTHHDTHGALAIRAARARKHVMMEKPLALTLEECYDVADAVERSGIKFMTAFKLRYYPAVARVREFIPRPIVTIAQMMDRRWPDELWANDPVKGGGNVLSQGCHTMDLIYYLNQAEPIRVYAEGGNFTHPKFDIVDNIAATVLFANGALASVVQGDAGHTPFVSKFSFQVMDGLRSAHLHDRLKTVTFFDGENVTEHRDAEEYGFMEESRDFVRALREYEDPPITHRDGIRATLMLLKVLDALRNGTPQTISY